MKKTNFFKLLMVGAAALSLGLAGCNYVSEKDFQEYCDKVDVLTTDVNALKTLLSGDVVKDITKNGNIVTVTYTGTKPAATLDFGGVGGTIITIDEDGQIFIDEDATGWYATDGAIAQGLYPKKSDDGKKWLFPTGEVGEDGEPVYVDGPSTLPGAFVVKDEITGLFTLNVPDEDGKMEEILLPGAGSNIGKIDIFGWKTGMLAADKDLSVASIKNLNTDVLEVNYAWIDKFVIDGQSSSITNQATPATTTTIDWEIGDNAVTEWEGKRKVGVNYVLNTLEASRTGLIIQVHPATTPVSKLVFELQNSKVDGVLPLAMGTPELLTGLLTRAAAESAVWFIPWKYTDGKPYAKTNGDHPDNDNPTNKKYSDLYKTNAVYSLVTEGNRSEYTPWTIDPVVVASTEAAIASINDTAIGTNGSFPNTYKAVVGTEYAVKFTESSTITDGKTNMVVDYYVEVRDNNQYVEEHFDVDINKANGTFKVNKQPDQLTRATFWLRVYKLGVDGVVYVEDIEIYVTREDTPVVVRDADYLLVDNNKYSVTTGTLSDPDNKAELEKMFVELAKISDSEFTNLELRWQNYQYGAKYWNLSGVKIGGKAVNGSAYEDKINVDPAVKPTLDQWKAMFYAAGSQIKFSKTSSTNVSAENDVTGTMVPTAEGYMPAPDLYDANYIIMQPSYARADGTTPMFEIGTPYELTFEFYDNDKDYLSTAIVKFTPTIPALDDMFEKYPKKWNSDLTTLMAFYEAPPTWVDNYFYTAGKPFGANTTSTFYNVYATTAQIVQHNSATPYDGGFLKFGIATADATQWLDNSTTLDYQRNGQNNVTQVVNENGASDAEKLVDWYTNIGAVTAQGTNSVIELINQTPNESTKDIAYNTDLAMTIKPGKYLGVYEYSKYETTKAQLADLNFNLRLMSAVERGEIKGSGPAGEIVADINAASVGEVFQITDEHFAAYNYNNDNATTQKYSLFTVDGTKYLYTYIKEVQFFIPEGQQTYTFADENGDMVNSTTATEIFADPVAAVGTTPAVPGYGYVAIKSRSTFQTSDDTKIGVKVIDRFGKSKSAEITIKVTVH